MKEDPIRTHDELSAISSIADKRTSLEGRKAALRLIRERVVEFLPQGASNQIDYIHIEGNSMSGMGIYDQDIVLYHKTKTVNSGDLIIVALYSDDYQTNMLSNVRNNNLDKLSDHDLMKKVGRQQKIYIKELSINFGKVSLLSHNKDISPYIIHDFEQITVIGKPLFKIDLTQKLLHPLGHLLQKPIRL